MTEMYEKELQTAIQAVTLAAEICTSVQAKIDGDALQKKDRSPVTIADFASQAVICRELKLAFPLDEIVAEEDAKELRSAEHAEFLDQIVSEIVAVGLDVGAGSVLEWIDEGNHNGTASRFWTLDPIDGTKGFLRKEQYAVSLALIVDGIIRVAALACPNLSANDTWDNAQGVVFSAIRGRGTKVSPLALPGVTPHTVRVSTTSTPEDARMCESVESRHSSHGWSGAIRTHLGIKKDPVRLDSQAKYGVVARGEADVYLRLPVRADYQEKIWDHAGGVLVIEEAGGTVTDIDGQPLDFSQGATLNQNRGVVATNGLLHDAVLSAVARSQPSLLQP